MPELIPAAPGSPEWLAARRTGVTATDIVTILGLSSWNSPYSLFWQKMGQVPEPADNDRFRLGRELEPYVCKRWRLEHGYGLSNIIDGQLYRSSDRPWQMATLDRWLVGDLEGWPLECKTWADADRHSWADAPPATVRAQVLWQMDVMDVAVGHVGVVFLPSGEFRSYTIEHEHQDWRDAETGQLAEDPSDCDVCADLAIMRAAGEEFMARLRLELPAPDPDSSAASLAAVRARFARQPDKQAEIDRRDWRDFTHLKDELGIYQQKVRAVEIKLREQAGEASVYTVDGQPVARRITGDAHVEAHTRHNDYLRRIKQEASDDE